MNSDQDEIDAFLSEMIQEDKIRIKEAMKHLNIDAKARGSENGDLEINLLDETRSQQIGMHAEEVLGAQSTCNIGGLPWDCQLMIFSWVPNLLTMAALNRFYFKNILHSMKELTLMRNSSFESLNRQDAEDTQFTHQQHTHTNRNGTVVINMLTNSFSLRNIHFNFYIAPHSVFESLQSQTLALYDVSTEFYFDLWNDEYSTKSNQKQSRTLGVLWKEINHSELIDSTAMDENEMVFDSSTISPKNRSLQEGLLYHGTWISIKRCRDDKLICVQEDIISASNEKSTRKIVLLSQANLKKQKKASGKWKIYFLDGGILHSRSKFLLVNESGAILTGSDHFLKMGFRDVYHTLNGLLVSKHEETEGIESQNHSKGESSSLTLSDLMNLAGIGDRLLWRLDEIEIQLMYRNKKRLVYDLST
uniref:Uncharacterized protein n=1 Tax=Percolomonas cosmopolitus TaxID=63605 RepID=A0A7S1PHK1_9EUKA|mmetsp:Transcript_5642/g.21243  ORF Transcript_5642/g.21243 Transcript_5642/m.21243 type:complete len:418 (+) Transcript_5642:205-1458(+)|eukprot:CAMPEP_0117439644 /NCGR_PEP_ID=MMETSP0759-20121206/2670_1 /TAXON_ID=63605 /ORGANISM="Percolomonas cosmopolitus, Strain WS" /LENGTH=417 /DNA_ID=CAMNT_0005231363 /DNA_START=113 /DNA_END=1366 /DNA_ORIENTATION=-